MNLLLVSVAIITISIIGVVAGGVNEFGCRKGTS